MSLEAYPRKEAPGEWLVVPQMVCSNRGSERCVHLCQWTASRLDLPLRVHIFGISSRRSAWVLLAQRLHLVCRQNTCIPMAPATERRTLSRLMRVLSSFL